MSLKDSIKGFIFEEGSDAVEEKAPAKAPTKTYAGATSVAPTQTNSYVPSSSASASVTTSGKMKERLVDEMNKNLAGSPYLQYQKMNISMKAKIADVSTRCAAMGVAFDGQGITKQKLLEGANNALNFFNGESTSFQTSISSTVSNLEQQLLSKNESVANAIADKQKMISQLTEEITSLQKEKTEFEIKVSQEKGRLETSKVEFNASFNEIVQEINKDITDITTYLGV